MTSVEYLKVRFGHLVCLHISVQQKSFDNEIKTSDVRCEIHPVRATRWNYRWRRGLLQAFYFNILFQWNKEQHVSSHPNPTRPPEPDESNEKHSAHFRFLRLTWILNWILPVTNCFMLICSATVRCLGEGTADGASCVGVCDCGELFQPSCSFTPSPQRNHTLFSKSTKTTAAAPPFKPLWDGST